MKSWRAFLKTSKKNTANPFDRSDTESEIINMRVKQLANMRWVEKKQAEGLSNAYTNAG